MADKYPQESVVFKCNATGSPKPQISWFHNGQKVAPSNVGRIQINSKNELKFTSLQSGDKGTVQCFATNDAGEAISKASLNVIKSEYQLLWFEFEFAPAQFANTSSQLVIKRL